MKRNTTIFATLIMIALLAAVFILTAQRCYTIEKEACFNTLTNDTVDLADKINRDFTGDLEHLRFISRVLGQFGLGDFGNTAKVLSSYEGGAVVSYLELLYPEGSVLTGDGSLVDAGQALSFSEISAKGEHISGRSRDLTDPGRLVLREYVPVVSQGETIALLCGVVDLSELPQVYRARAFDGQTQSYIIDSGTGDFLMDTWHNELANISVMATRMPKTGYSFERMSHDIEHMASGSTVFRSQTANEYFYCYYEPVGTERWMVLLSVPASVAFGRLHRFMTAVYALAVVMILVLVLYFMWLLISIRRESHEKESQLKQVQYMYDVEKILFNAYLNPADIHKALWRIGQMMTARYTFLLIPKDGVGNRSFTWGSIGAEPDPNEVDTAADQVLSYLKDNGPVITYAPRALFCAFPDLVGLADKLKLKNLALVPVTGSGDEITGLLGACDMKHRWKNTGLLDCVALSFAMMIHNMDTFQSIKNMGMIDSLTGLLNRNSYLADISAAEPSQYRSLACVYLDANGLHELNNHLGHAAGDQMLCALADELKIAFGSKNTYRIGGDEFLAICKNLPRDEVIRRTSALKEAVLRQGYYTSVGIEWRDQDCNISAIVKAAEAKMQEDKRCYYQKDVHNRRIREMNHQLEQLIVEKQDADAFLSVIASSFKGVYFVNLDTDEVRHIFIPEYFDEMLSASCQKFSQAILLYARNLVCPEYLPQFTRLCAYDSLEKLLDEDNVPEITYRKTDGTCLKLQVFKFKKYRQGSRETLWVFQEADPPETGA
ncbi:MAG: GGDEF domain-containing protein [Enterocloster asparagiformis]|nr:GGDEF domain-containing protein [Enterocloster asparagiformis]